MTIPPAPSGDISDSQVFDMTYAGQLSFGRLPASRDLSAIDLAIVGIPFDLGTTNRPGTRLGPRAIREQSTLTAEFPSGLWPWDHSVFDRHRVVDYFDIGFAPGYTEEMLTNTVQHVSALLEAGANVLALGGDHMIAYPLLQATAAKYGPLSLIHFDAHSDTWDAGEELNHGTMFLRAAREGLIVPEYSVQVGMRTPNESHGFNVIHADRFFEIGVEATVAEIHRTVGDRPAYLSFDIDFLDPAFAPGTGTPVIGGATTWQARQLLFGLKGLDIVGADLVEVSPPYDAVTNITALAGATLAHDELYLLGLAREQRASQG
ncbi:MAG TPA: agmatinase [Acidimicrobiaceae bacterium]|jgi:agmatinase|nr:agmatinase [Acidimicrobiaceae bacterium]